jgi:multicomponent Na+:H+ antiporter subunit D
MDSWMLPLLVAVPLLAAAVVAGGEHVLPRRVRDAIGIAAAATVCALALVVMTNAERGEVVHWFGGWRPRGGIAIGLDFAADPLSAGLAALAGGVVLAALLFSWTYLHEAARLVDTLMLVCCGALCGFAVSGDLFNMFVWLELMGVAAYALTGFEIRQLGPLQGAVNFAITNTVAGLLVLTGIALVYGRTGALNLAQIGRTIAAEKPDGLLVVAFTLVVCGFLCKAAVVPFQFWLADAYAVAPAPVCSIFAGAMTEVGLLGVARVYWTAFSGPFGAHPHAVGDLLLWLGVVTALVGGVMAFLQRHLKRMLAYSVVCHVGIVLAGIGLLSSRALAGGAVVLLAHGLLVAGLFLAVGVLVLQLRSVDELHLHGRGRGKPLLGAVWAAGALALAGPPYVGLFLGHSLLDDAATEAGRQWLPPLLWLAGAITSAALLRCGARIFLGAGVERDPLLSPEMEERPPARGGRPGLLLVVATALVVLGAAVSLVPGLAQRSLYGADRFRDRAAYAASVLDGRAVRAVPQLPFAIAHASLASLLYGVGATLFAVGLAAVGLSGVRLPRPLEAPLVGLKALHSGIIGDYVMWLTAGTALIGGVWAVTLR